MTSDFDVNPIRYNDISVKTDVPAKMRDGTILYADIYRPNCDEDLPVLLMRTPYDKRTAQNCVYLDPSWYARYGYMVVVQDCRGRFASQGEWYPFKNEANDGFDSVEWAASLPGSNGAVGMYGFSYPGATQLLAASGKPKGLKTIVPAMTGSDAYDRWTYEGGVLSQAFIQYWSISLAINTATRANDYNTVKRLMQMMMQLPGSYGARPLSEIPEELSKYAPYYEEWLNHDCYDAYWREFSVRERYSEIDLPILHVGGWYDVFMYGTMENFSRLSKMQSENKTATKARQKLVVGPWYHVPWQQQFGVNNYGDKARNIVNAAQLKWFDHYLRGEGQATEKNDPDLSVFVLGANEWLHLPTWPDKELEQQQLFLHSGGRANSLSGDGSLSMLKPSNEPWDSFIYDPSFPIMSSGGHSCCAEIFGPMGPGDQRTNQSRNDVLVYSSETLEEDLTVLGLIKATVFASSSAVDTDFSITVSDVFECGRSINIVNTIIKASRAQSLEHENKIAANTVHEYNFNVGWTACNFKKGHKIRVEISSSNFPHFHPNANNGLHYKDADIKDLVHARQTVFHDEQHPSHIVLPVFRSQIV